MDVVRAMAEKYRKLNSDRQISKLQFLAVGIPHVVMGLRELEHYYILVNVETGELVCDKFFADYGYFSDGVAPVFDGKWGYIKENGEYLVEPAYMEAQESRNNVLVVRERNGKYRLLLATMSEPLCSDTFTSVDTFYEDEDTLPEAYIVSQYERYGVIHVSGEWLVHLDEGCKCIEPLADDVAYLEYEEGRGEIRRLSTQETLVSGKHFEFGYEKRFNVISCRDEENKLVVYKWNYDKLEKLFAEVCEFWRMDVPKLIHVSDLEYKGKQGIFSIPERKWIARDLMSVKVLERNGNYFYRIVQAQTGLMDENGDILLPTEMSWLKFLDTGIVLARNTEGWGAYDLFAKKWIFVPQADKVDVLHSGTFALGYLYKGVFGRKKYVWRYVANGRFVSCGFFTTCNDFEDVGGKKLAKVTRLSDDKKGWIDYDGNFYPEKDFKQKFKEWSKRSV